MINNCHYSSLSNILQLGPRLSNDSLQQIVLSMIDNSNGQTIVIGVYHVYNDVGKDHHGAHDEANGGPFVIYYSKWWDYKGDLHVDLQGPGLLIAARVWHHCVWENVSQEQKRPNPIRLTSLHVHISRMPKRSFSNTCRQTPNEKPHSIVNRSQPEELSGIYFQNIFEG